MATLAAWDDWWVAILDVKHVDLGTSGTMSKVRMMGTSYHVRLGHRATTVATVKCDNPGRDHDPDKLAIQWLRPEAEFRFRAVARTWWETVRNTDSDTDFATVRSAFLRMLVWATAQLQRWPGIAMVGVSGQGPQPAPGVDASPALGSIEVAGSTHRLTGWVDGQLVYTAPDGREFEVTASPELLRAILLACASQFGTGAAP